ncbi:hypothetical protein FJR11_04395 [Anabaena sp. UHCC 0187]|uniref:hypothetical protein n=1 Tax=Anabaena sp. UHCC 0187 TaxID=2590018 RepID=UPI001444F041|nr:hypothetical protein [Anabaena sp. UHCC 0187]MTJ11847.1 hypothetical protein [Anabaena sp. UHCC 0187]
MSKRFNNLDAALKYLRPVNATAETEVPDAPAGTPLRKYQDYKAGKVAITYTRATASLPGDIKVIALKPFAFPAASTLVLKSGISNRALINIGDYGLTAAEAGIDTAIPAEAQEAVGFTPAKAICKKVTGTTASSTPSKILGSSYKRKTSNTHTIPLGRTTTGASWGAQKGIVLAKVSAAAGNTSVSFKPEKY